ncbi:sensor histidine kinase [Okeania sp. SIO1I7]|uniref:sensor histidine kinase n=1 Tax=Okeania sp. SIO1I7 TaxID=2607772 RepID=UPI0013F87025|nr:ATP-binding protein [Okeania sp. SIO1I7]NET29277.1 GHKL domain-containing protein [Okeania sp. SIO1I7]
MNKSSINSKELQILLIFYSAAGIFVISVLVAIVSILPLYKQLKVNEESNLQSALRTRTLAVEEFISKVKSIAVQIASRTQARLELEAYNRSLNNRDSAVSNITRYLSDALNQSEDVVGITRFDQNNQLIVQLGLPIPQKFWDFPIQNSQNTQISNPIRLKNQSYIIVSQAIFNSNQQQQGKDLVLFKTEDLEKIITDYTGLGQTGEIFLGTFQNQQVKLFLSSRNQANTLSEPIIKALEKTVVLQESGLTLIKPKFWNYGQIIAFEPLSKVNWGLVIKIDRQELYASVNHQIITIGIIIITLSFMGAGGMVLLLRPLAGQVIIQTDELEEQLQEKNRTLHELNYAQGQLLLEIKERKQAENLLRESEAKLREQKQELQQTLKELQQTQAQMIQSEKMSSLGQMVAGVAHEINNPVNFIHGNIVYAKDYIQDLLNLIQLYQDYYPHPHQEIEAEIEEIELNFLQKDLKKILKSMEVGTERIREIVKSLRIFSRCDEAEIKKVDLHEGIESTLMILQSHFKAKSQSEYSEIQIIKEYGQLPLIDCYPGQLNQVFMNILSNAIYAIKDAQNSQKIELNSGCIRIKTQRISDNLVQICITDNGGGISEEVLSHLFDPFFTTKPVGKGTGLGLSISYQIIVEKHKGKLECHSQKEKYTEFIITIPIKLS